MKNDSGADSGWHPGFLADPRSVKPFSVTSPILYNVEGKPRSNLPDETPNPVEVTILIDAACAGDSKASAKLLPLVYEQLRRLAQSNMNKERPGLTLQPTALVHEAYMRLLGPTDGPEIKWESRGHFFAMAALAMRRILVERARRRDRIKHGGDRARVDMPIEAIVVESESTDLLALDEALKKLELEDERRYNVVMLRYFAGLSIDDTAAAMKVSIATVKTDWAIARVWLYRVMQGERPAEEQS